MSLSHNDDVNLATHRSGEVMADHIARPAIGDQGQVDKAVVSLQISDVADIGRSGGLLAVAAGDTRLASPYNLLVSSDWPDKKLGLFQVKTRFYDEASLALTSDMVAALLLWYTGYRHRAVQPAEVPP